MTPQERAALARLRRARARVAALEVARRKRDALIVQARELGLPNGVVADAAGVAPSRVSQLMAGVQR